MQRHFLRARFKLLNLVSPRWTASLAVSLFCAPRRYPAAPWEADSLAKGASDQLPFDGELLDATIWEQSGPTVLLIHGWQGRRGQLGKIAVALVDKGYRVVAIDSPAHGSSIKQRTTLVEFAQAIHLAADRYGPLHAIVGHSFGAAAVAMALRDGVQAQRAVLISSPFSLRNVVRSFANMMGLPNRSHEQMYPIMQNLHGCPESELSFATIGPRLRLPCLIMHDQADRYVSVEDGVRIWRNLRDAQWVRTQGLGHTRILQADAVVERVADFVAQPAN